MPDFERDSKGRIVGNLPNALLALSDPAFCGCRFRSGGPAVLAFMQAAGSDRWLVCDLDRITALRERLIRGGFHTCPKGVTKDAVRLASRRVLPADDFSDLVA